MEHDRRSQIKSVLVFSLLIAIMVMSVGYAALSQRLTVNSNATIGDASWKVRIVSIEETSQRITGADGNVSTQVGNIEGVSFSTNIEGSTSAAFSIGLKAPGDYATFKVSVKNMGTISAKLNGITDLTTINSSNPSVIKYTVTEDTNNGTSLSKDGYDYYYVKVEWDATDGGINNPEPDENGNLVQKNSKTAIINFDYVQS